MHRHNAAIQISNITKTALVVSARMARWWLWSVLLCVLVIPRAWAEVTARVDSTRITIDESLNLQLESTAADGSPDFSGLQQDFSILGTSTQSQAQITNGRIQQSRTWNLELLPRRVGQLVIPVIEVGGERSEAITIEVMNARELKPGDDIGDYHVDVQVDNRSPYVQSQVLYTIRVYHTERLLEGSLGSPTSDSVIVEQLGEDQLMRATRNGRQYRVLERKLAVFPQKSGELILPGVLLDASVAADGTRVQGFFTPTTKVRRRSAPLTLDVQPKPAGSGWWLPARAVSIESTGGDTADNSLRVGESFTRTIRLSATGVNGAQLPVITLPDSDLYRIYADQPQINQSVETGGLGAERIEKWAVVAQSPGQLTLPEIRVPWFNVVTGEQEVASLPAETLTILPAATRATDALPATTETTLPQADNTTAANNGSETTALSNGAAPLNDNTPAASLSLSANAETATTEVTDIADTTTDATGNSVIEGLSSGVARGWQIAAVALGFLWLATLALLFRVLRRWSQHGGDTPAGSGWPDTRHGRRHGVGRRSIFSRKTADLDGIRRASDRQDAVALARAVVTFGAEQWPDQHRHSVLGVAAAIDDPALTPELTRLDQAAYSIANNQRAALNNTSDNANPSAIDFAKIYSGFKRYTKAHPLPVSDRGTGLATGSSNTAVSANRAADNHDTDSSPDTPLAGDALPRL